MKKSIKIAFSGILCALSVALMFLGSVLWIFSYAMPIVCGLILIIAMRSIDKRTAVCIYFCTAALSMLLISDKESALLYTAFFGYYPIIKERFDKIKPHVLSSLSKLALFNVCVVIWQLICVYVFGIPIDNFLGKWGIAVLLLLGNLVFVIYDRLFSVLVILYDKKLSDKIKKYFK